MIVYLGGTENHSEANGYRRAAEAHEMAILHSFFFLVTVTKPKQEPDHARIPRTGLSTDSG